MDTVTVVADADRYSNNSGARGPSTIHFSLPETNYYAQPYNEEQPYDTTTWNATDDFYYEHRLNFISNVSRQQHYTSIKFFFLLLIRTFYVYDVFACLLLFLRRM
jgi:hypothetical protein